MGRIIFITGTDTGVGKTLMTALLLSHLRSGGEDAVAIKPFCAGGREDIDILQSFQEGVLTDREMNPFYFKKPLAPLAGGAGRRAITLGKTVRVIRAVAARHEMVLVEGIGGVMVPLGEGFSVLDLIQGLKCPVIVVAANRLGALNHTLLTVRALLGVTGEPVKVVLSEGQKGPADLLGSNRRILGEWLAPGGVQRLPKLGGGGGVRGLVEANCKKLKKVLAAILESASFSPSFESGRSSGPRKD